MGIYVGRQEESVGPRGREKMSSGIISRRESGYVWAKCVWGRSVEERDVERDGGGGEYR